MMENREAEANEEKEVEIRIERSDSPSSSSFARVGGENFSSDLPISGGGGAIGKNLGGELRTIACPSCAHHIPISNQGGILNDLPGMPAGMKFDPTDVEILEHLEAKVRSDSRKLHPLIDEFIQTLEDENGICYTHPEKLPGVSKDGLIRHYFHRPSKAYTTGTRKRRKVSSDEDDAGETRWHKTGKTRAVVVNGSVKGFKKILVLYANYGRQKKPEKTKWVMHQYHIGHSEDEKEGELVLSKVFYQTQPRNTVLLPPQPQAVAFKQPLIEYPQQQQQQLMLQQARSSSLEYYHQQQQQPRFISFDRHDRFVVGGGQESKIRHQLVSNLGVQVDQDGSSFVSLDGKGKEQF